MSYTGDYYFTGKGDWKKAPEARCCLNVDELKAYMDATILENINDYIVYQMSHFE